MSSNLRSSGSNRVYQRAPVRPWRFFSMMLIRVLSEVSPVATNTSASLNSSSDMATCSARGPSLAAPPSRLIWAADMIGIWFEPAVSLSSLEMMAAMSQPFFARSPVLERMRPM